MKKLEKLNLEEVAMSSDEIKQLLGGTTSDSDYASASCGATCQPGCSTGCSAGCSTSCTTGANG
jgi:natural product precursor